MKTLIVLLALSGAVRAQQAEPAARPAPKADAPTKIDPRWTVDPRAAAALQAAAAHSARVQGVLPAADGGGWEDFSKAAGREYPVTAPPTGSGLSGSYVFGLVKVEDGPGGKKEVRGDLTGLVLPDSRSTSLTIGDLEHPAPIKNEDGTPATSMGRPVSKGPSAAVAVTLKLHW